MYSIFRKQMVSLLFVFSIVVLMLPGFSQKSIAANTSTDKTSLQIAKYLIAQLNLASRPFAESPTFNTNIIEQMYRGSWVGGQWQSSDGYPGGLAGAVRRQLSKGELVGGKDHLVKGRERLANLKDVITKGKIGNELPLSPSDMSIARSLHDDLLSALQTKK
jgi:hypothetical protein